MISVDVKNIVEKVTKCEESKKERWNGLLQSKIVGKLGKRRVRNRKGAWLEAYKSKYPFL